MGKDRKERKSVEHRNLFFHELEKGLESVQLLSLRSVLMKNTTGNSISGHYNLVEFKGKRLRGKRWMEENNIHTVFPQTT